MREHRIGIIQLLKELSTTPERVIDIRILTPTNNAIEKILKELKITTTTTISITSVPKEESIFPFSSDNSHLKIRYLELFRIRTRI